MGQAHKGLPGLEPQGLNWGWGRLCRPAPSGLAKGEVPRREDCGSRPYCQDLMIAQPEGFPPSPTLENPEEGESFLE